MPDHTINEGRKVKRFRETPGNNEDALTRELGDASPDRSRGHREGQQKISLPGQKGAVDANVLQQIISLLKIPVGAFQNFDQEKTVNIIGNTFTDFKGGASAINIRPVFNNPLEAILKLHEEKTALYERMLKEKDEMMARVERLLEQK